MKVRNCVSVPTVISPLATFVPPSQSTSPMARKNEKFIAEPLFTLRSTRSCASSSACCEVVLELASIS